MKVGTINIIGNMTDLHTHTCYSDGDLSPEEVVELARRKGLRALSITDHDTIDGLEPARKACNEQKITFIPGIEFTTETEYAGIEVHILGYNIDPDNHRLLKLTDHAKENAKEYSRKVCSALEAYGWEIDHSILESVKGIITKHDITMSVTNNDMNNYDFHNQWLSDGSPLNIEMQKFPARKVIDIIHRSGGKAVCAHMIRTLEQTGNMPLLPYITGSLVRHGLDGFEVFYANSNKEQVRTMYELCSKQSLIMTGGSDFHGPNRTGRCQLGEYNTYSRYEHHDMIRKLCYSSNCTMPKILA
ncbi:PHP domain-containing protein [Methanolobus profundi]|nr:PHP domain-containing protein [Methanolobus profundi]